MPYKVTNVSLEHQHSLKRRTATRLQMEPIIVGKRLLLRQSVLLSDMQYLINKDILDQCVKDGVITVESTEPTTSLTMPEDVPSIDRSRELPLDSVAVVDGLQEVIPPAPESPSIFPGQLTNTPNSTVTNSPPSGGNYPQRRDDRKRGR